MNESFDNLVGSYHFCLLKIEVHYDHKVCKSKISLQLHDLSLSKVSLAYKKLINSAYALIHYDTIETKSQQISKIRKNLLSI